MNIFKLTKFIGLIVMLFGCEQASNQVTEVRYLPYFDQCRSTLDRTLELLRSADGTSVSSELISVTDQLVQGNPFPKYVRIELTTDRAIVTDSLINFYLFECGPDASIIFEAGQSYDDSSIRKSIGFVLGNEIYRGNYLVGLDDGQLVIYFNKP